MQQWESAVVTQPICDRATSQWKPGYQRPQASSPPFRSSQFTSSSTHPVFVEVVSLHTGTLEAELALTTVGTICPGEVAGLAHHLPLGLASAPQLAAVLHVWTGLRAHAKGQLTLLAQGIAGARQVLRQGDGLAGLVQQAVTCRESRTFIRTSWGRWVLAGLRRKQ